MGAVTGVLEHRPAHASQGMAFSVAMNSKRANAIVALLIASNFAEIKGVVFKRFDARRLLILSCQVRMGAPSCLPEPACKTLIPAPTAWPMTVSRIDLAPRQWCSRYIRCSGL